MTITKTEFKEELQQLTTEELCLFIISLYGNNVDVADDFIIWKNHQNHQKQAQQPTAKPLEPKDVDKKVIQTIHKKILCTRTFHSSLDFIGFKGESCLKNSNK